MEGRNEGIFPRLLLAVTVVVCWFFVNSYISAEVFEFMFLHLVHSIRLVVGFGSVGTPRSELADLFLGRKKRRNIPTAFVGGNS